MQKRLSHVLASRFDPGKTENEIDVLTFLGSRRFRPGNCKRQFLARGICTRISRLVAVRLGTCRLVAVRHGTFRLCGAAGTRRGFSGPGSHCRFSTRSRHLLRKLWLRTPWSRGRRRLIAQRWARLGGRRFWTIRFDKNVMIFFKARRVNYIFLAR